MQFRDLGFQEFELFQLTLCATFGVVGRNLQVFHIGTCKLKFAIKKPFFIVSR